MRWIRGVARYLDAVFFVTLYGGRSLTVRISDWRKRFKGVQDEVF